MKVHKFARRFGLELNHFHWQNKVFAGSLVRYVSVAPRVTWTGNRLSEDRSLTIFAFPMTNPLRIAIVALSILVYSTSYSADIEPPGHYDPCVAAGVKNSVVFLGQLVKDSPQFHATGFIIKVDNILYLVTAKHVVWDSERKELNDAGLYAFFNDKKGNSVSRSIAEIKKKGRVDWVFSKDSAVDIAIIPFAFNPANDDLRIIPTELFEQSQRLSELQDVFFYSYQPGLEVQGKIAPIARRGMISRINEDRTFYIDAFVFPGNSGSPVFVKPNAMSFIKGGGVGTGDVQGCKFIGLAGEYLPYTDFAISSQTHHVRVAFEENAGLARIWSVEILQDIIKSEDFQSQHSHLRLGGK